MDALAAVLKRPERARRAEACCCRGLLMPLARKSVEPLAPACPAAGGASAPATPA